MTPQRFQEWVIVAMRDLLIPGLGAYLTFKGYTSGALEPWHLPLLAGMMSTPLVGRAGVAKEPDLREKLPPGQEEGSDTP